MQIERESAIGLEVNENGFLVCDEIIAQKYINRTVEFINVLGVFGHDMTLYHELAAMQGKRVHVRTRIVQELRHFLVLYIFLCLPR